MATSTTFDTTGAMGLNTPVSRKPRKRGRLFAILGLVAVVLLLVGIKAVQFRSMMAAGKAMVPPPEAVTSAKVQAAQWRTTQSAAATLIALQAVVVSAEVPGRIEKIFFDSGTTAKQGAPLIELDASAERAQLRAAEAQASLAAVNLRRDQLLRRQGAIPPAQLQNADAQAKQARAAVAVNRAIIDKKVITAPFSGRITIREVEVGQVLSPGTRVATLQSVTPIYAEFWLPQQALANLKVGQRVLMKTDTFPNASWDGQVSIINPEVDVATRNVRIRATFDNDDGRLTPGMFVNVQVVADQAEQVTIIPATSVMHAPYGDSVFVLEPKKEGKEGKEAGPPIARQRFIRLGDRKGDFVAVVSGLSPNEIIVSNGAFKLKNGMPVQVNNALAPKPQVAPTPSEN